MVPQTTYFMADAQIERFIFTTDFIKRNISLCRASVVKSGAFCLVCRGILIFLYFIFFALKFFLFGFKRLSVIRIINLYVCAYIPC